MDIAQLMFDPAMLAGSGPNRRPDSAQRQQEKGFTLNPTEQHSGVDFDPVPPPPPQAGPSYQNDQPDNKASGDAERRVAGPKGELAGRSAGQKGSAGVESDSPSAKTHEEKPAAAKGQRVQVAGEATGKAVGLGNTKSDGGHRVGSAALSVLQSEFLGPRSHIPATIGPPEAPLGAHPGKHLGHLVNAPPQNGLPPGLVTNPGLSHSVPPQLGVSHGSGLTVLPEKPTMPETADFQGKPSFIPADGGVPKANASPRDDGNAKLLLEPVLLDGEADARKVSASVRQPMAFHSDPVVSESKLAQQIEEISAGTGKAQGLKIQAESRPTQAQAEARPNVALEDTKLDIKVLSEEIAAAGGTKQNRNQSAHSSSEFLGREGQKDTGLESGVQQAKQAQNSPQAAQPAGQVGQTSDEGAGGNVLIQQGRFPAAPANTQHSQLQGDATDGLREQIRESIQNSLEQGRQQVVVKLHPPELGKVAIRFEEQNRQLTGLLEAERQQTRVEIQNALPQILRSLQQSGIQIKRIDVMLSDSQQQSQQSLKDHWLQDGWTSSQQHGSANQGRYPQESYSTPDWQWQTEYPQSFYDGTPELSSLAVSQAGINVLI